jgi:hypothetical protein
MNAPEISRIPGPRCSETALSLRSISPFINSPCLRFHIIRSVSGYAAVSLSINLAHFWQSQIPLVTSVRSSGERFGLCLGPPREAAEMCAATPTLIAFLSFVCGPLVATRQSGFEQRCPARFAKDSLTALENSSRTQTVSHHNSLVILRKAKTDGRVDYREIGPAWSPNVGYGTPQGRFTPKARKESRMSPHGRDSELVLPTAGRISKRYTRTKLALMCYEEHGRKPITRARLDQVQNDLIPERHSWAA